MANRNESAVEVKVDRELKRRWERELSVLRKAKRDGASAFDQKYESLGRIVESDPPLYLAGGYSTVGAFLAGELDEDERTVRRWIRVARFASPHEEARFGPTKLDAALSYLEALAGEPLRRVPVDFEKLRIPVERDGESVRLSLEQATVAEIQAATKQLAREGKSSVPKEAKLIAAALKAEGLAKATVRVARGMLSIGRVPLDAVGALAKALRSVKLPKGS